MSNHFGGGGGKGGFKHMLGHLGPAAKSWLDDMHAHAYEYNESNLDVLNTSVQEMLSDMDEKQVESQRDEMLIDLLRKKKVASALV
jgi:3-hydroxyacyl-CoA dehydrogenase